MKPLHDLELVSTSFARLRKKLMKQDTSSQTTDDMQLETDFGHCCQPFCLFIATNHRLFKFDFLIVVIDMDRCQSLHR